MTENLSMDFPATYRIKVHGIVKETWFQYYDHMVIEVETGTLKHPVTTLTGRIADQTALQGMLNLLYELRLPLLSVECLLSANHDAHKLDI